MGITNDAERRRRGLQMRRYDALKLLNEMKSYREKVIAEGTFTAKYVVFTMEIRALDRAINSLLQDREDDSKEAT